MALTIKPEFQNKVLGFNGSAIPLGQRSQVDLKVLLVLAYQSHRADYVNYYVSPPTLNELLGGSTGGSFGPLVTMGTLYSKSIFTEADLAADFEPNGANASIVEGMIELTRTGTGTLDKSIDLLAYTGLEKWEMTAEIVPIVQENGFGIGVRPTNGVFHTVGAVSAAATPNGILFYGPEAGIDETGAQVTITNGVPFKLSISQDGDFICVKFNGTTVLTHVIDISQSGDFMHSAGRFAFYSFGGTYRIKSILVKSSEVVGAPILCIGDSKTAGAGADHTNETFVNLLKGYYGQNVVAMNAGPGDISQDVLNKMPEILKMKAKRAVLNIGTNDKHKGVPFGTWAANYDAIVSQLTAGGIDVYHLLMLNEAVKIFDDYNAHIRDTYPANRIIDAGIVGLHPDGVHNSTAGQKTIFGAIKTVIGPL